MKYYSNNLEYFIVSIIKLNFKEMILKKMNKNLYIVFQIHVDKKK